MCNEEYHPNYDLQDPQEHYQLIRNIPGLWSQGCLPIPMHCRSYGDPLQWRWHKYYQSDWMLAQRWYAAIFARPSKTYHEEIIVLNARTWHILLHAPPRGTLFITFVSSKPLPCFLLPPFPPLSHRDSLPTQGSIPATKRGPKTKKWLRGGGQSCYQVNIG